MNTETMELQHRTHVSTSCRVAPPVQGPTPRLNMAIVQLNTGDENLQGRRWGMRREKAQAFLAWRFIFSLKTSCLYTLSWTSELVWLWCRQWYLTWRFPCCSGQTLIQWTSGSQARQIHLTAWAVTLCVSLALPTKLALGVVYALILLTRREL